MKFRLPALLLSGVLYGALASTSAHAQLPVWHGIQNFKTLMEPVGNMISRGDGSFYGVARWGLDGQGGFVYRIAPLGEFQVIHSFGGEVEDTGEANFGGASPSSPLVLGPDFAFYGATRFGGAHGNGTLYRISPDGIFGVVHHFREEDGSEVRDILPTPTGEIFGTTRDGGPDGGGTIFRVATDGSFETVHAFEEAVPIPWNTPVAPGERREPASPRNLALGPDGEIYGTTSVGGPFHPSGNYLISYGTFFHYDGEGSVTILSEFDSLKNHPTSLNATTDGFYITTDRHLVHMGLTGTLTVAKDFATVPPGILRPTLMEPVVTSRGVFGSTRYGGEGSVGFMYRYTPAAGAELFHSFLSENLDRSLGMVEAQDGRIYGLAARDQHTASEPPVVAAIAPATAGDSIAPRRGLNYDLFGPRFFYLRESGIVEYPPVAKPDIAWLPAKAKNGKRELIVDVLANDKDPDGASLSLAGLVDIPENVSASIVSTARGQRVKIVSTEADPAGAVVTYIVSDGQGGSSTGYVSIKSAATGSFRGTVSGGSVANAPLSVAIGKNNVATATFTLAGKKYTGKATLDVDDTADLSLSAKGAAPLNLQLNLLRGNSRSLAITIVDGANTYIGTCQAVGKK